MAELLPNPWTDAAAYDRITVAGVEFAGKNDLSADELLKKKSDHRRARGRNGGRSVSTGWDLVEFQLTLTAYPYGPDGAPSPSFAQLEEILRRVGRGAVAAQDQTAVSISHPYLDAVGISQVTVEGVGFVPVQTGGTFGLKLKLKEWRAPTQNPGARAPAAAPQSRMVSAVSDRDYGPGFAALRPLGPPQPNAPRPAPPPAAGPSPDSEDGELPLTAMGRRPG